MRIIIEPHQLTIKLEGFEQLWAFKRQIQVPRRAIVEVDFLSQMPTLQDYRGYLRFPGTILPWRFLAGTYFRKHHYEFWYVHTRQPGVLTLIIEPGVLRYDKIRLTSTPEIAQSVADWWQEEK